MHKQALPPSTKVPQGEGRLALGFFFLAGGSCIECALGDEINSSGPAPRQPEPGVRLDHLRLFMKQSAVRFLLVCCLLLPTAPAGANPPPENSAGTPWVEWDRSTEHIVSAANDPGAAYPRAKQLSNGEILLAYHHDGGVGDYGAGVTLRKSRDGGATWYQTQEIERPAERGFWGFSNPDVIELGSGHLLLVSAARGKPGRFSGDWFAAEGRHSGLRLRFSDDYGATWSAPRMIAAGRGRVWEPSIVRLPGGEIEIFYANESPELEVEGSSQCIESIRSPDGGQTWTSPSIISEDPGCRNGMPAALALSNGHVVCGQEVVGRATSPWIADTVEGETRDYHLAQNQYDFGAAPFLARAPDGSTLLAFHSQLLQAASFKRLPMAWMFSQIYVQRGDAEAGNFGPASCPWPKAEPGTGAFFPSLLVMKGGTLVALASFITVHPNRTSSTVVRWIKGKMTTAAAGKPTPMTAAAATRPEESGLMATSPAAEPPPPRAAAEYRYGPPPEDDAGKTGAGN
jgi:hypothetical protein